MSRFFGLISQLIETNIPFYFYREPLSEKIIFAISAKNKVTKADFSKFSDISGFVISPFFNSSDNNSSDCLPTLVIRESYKFELPKDLSCNQFLISKITDSVSSIIKEESEYEFELPIINENCFYVSDKEEYLDQCSYAIKNIVEGNINKMILSRILKNDSINIDNGIDVFEKLIRRYDNAFVFFVHIPGFITWIGASPELLINYDRNVLTTASLAGTKKIKDNWTLKEYEEQQIVTDYILDVLEKNKCYNIKTDGPINKRAGNVEHLFTDITASVNKSQLSDLINSLHPTPALCGTPKSDAFKMINDIEKHSRLYYGGYLGIIDKNDSDADIIRLYVNLRSALLRENHSYLYIGGGITKDSIPEDEWEETVAKSETLVSVFNN